jgi:hypothetical protein
MYGTPHAVSWLHEQLVGHTAPPAAATWLFSAHTAVTNAGSCELTEALKPQNDAAPTNPRGHIMPPTDACRRDTVGDTRTKKTVQAQGRQGTSARESNQARANRERHYTSNCGRQVS